MKAGECLIHAITSVTDAGFDAGKQHGRGAIKVYAGFTSAVWLFA